MCCYASVNPSCAAIMLDITHAVGKFAPYLISGGKETMRGEEILSSVSGAEVHPQPGIAISLTKKKEGRKKKRDNMIDSNLHPPAPMFVGHSHMLVRSMLLLGIMDAQLLVRDPP